MIKAFMCAAPLIINLTTTPVDPAVLKRATYVCKTRYKGCLSKLIKKKERTYSVLCRRMENERRTFTTQGKD